MKVMYSSAMLHTMEAGAHPVGADAEVNRIEHGLIWAADTSKMLAWLVLVTPMCTPC